MSFNNTRQQKKTVFDYVAVTTVQLLLWCLLHRFGWDSKRLPRKYFVLLMQEFLYADCSSWRQRNSVIKLAENMTSSRLRKTILWTKQDDMLLQHWQQRKYAHKSRKLNVTTESENNDVKMQKKNRIVTENAIAKQKTRMDLNRQEHRTWYTTLLEPGWCHRGLLIDWVRLNVPPTHYRSYGDGFLRVKWPNQQCQSTEGR